MVSGWNSIEYALPFMSGELVRSRTPDLSCDGGRHQMRQEATERFRTAVTRAVAQLGGDRAAETASGVSKSVWYDAKTGRTVPDYRSTWPAMLAVLTRIPTASTGVRDWEELYRLMCSERGRRPHPHQSSSVAGPAPVRLVPQQLPPGTVPFVARDPESRVLDEVILGGNGESVPVAVVTGPPGVGKTALVVNWSHRALRHFPDGVLYVDLRGWSPDRPLTPEEVLPIWLRVFGMDPVDLPDDAPSLAAALRSVLAGKRILVVLDNARSEEQVRPLLPGSSSCAVLVTSRQELHGLAIHHGARMVTLGPLSSASAAGLLCEIAGAGISADAGTLARICGNLPLALRVVAESARGRSAAEIVALTAELNGADRLDGLSSDDPRSDPRTVLSWSYAQLPAQARDTFRLLGIFRGRSFDTSAVAAVTGNRPRQAGALVKTIARASLARPESGGRFGMHDLIGTYAAELAEATPDEQARTRLFSYYLHTAQQADAWVAPSRYRLPLPGSTPIPAPFRNYDEALRWFDAECQNMVALCLPCEDPSAGSQPGQAQVGGDEFDPLRWRLAFQLKSYFFLSKRIHEWLLSHEAALAAAIRVGDRSGEAMTRNNLGLAWHERGDDDQALAQYEAAERLFVDVGDPHGASNALANQAVVHRRRGDLDQALALNDRALGFYRQAAAEHPSSRRYIAITLHSIALVETECSQYTDAEGHLRESLELCAELGMTMDLARAWNALGAVLVLAGRPGDARDAHEAAVAAGKACGSRFEEAAAWQGLAAVAAATGDRSHAQQCLDAALELFTQLGSARADEVRANLAALGASQAS
jgi:tetratricopeptide (TPR) repeat protein